MNIIFKEIIWIRNKIIPIQIWMAGPLSFIFIQISLEQLLDEFEIELFDE